MKKLSESKKVLETSPSQSQQTNKMVKSQSYKSKGFGFAKSSINSLSSSAKKTGLSQINTNPCLKNNSQKIDTPTSKKCQSGKKTMEKSLLSKSRQNLNFKNKKSEIIGKQNKDEKKQTAPVKNIRNKAMGLKQINESGKQTMKKQTRKINFYQIATIQTCENEVKETTPRNKIKKNISLDNLNLQMFEIGRKLGKGRFGDVFMARQKQLGFVLAIKMINKSEVKQSQMEKQLLQEIKIQMFTSHPNVLKMYGFFEDQKKIYFLLELATSGCLFREIRQKVYFTEDQASLYFRQVVSAIRYLHSHSVIHRDIKPQNILNSFGVLKLCDFGWATYSPTYQRQTFCGTLDYVPPEIVTGQFYDEKVDVWCLGVLCYELCTGKAPFQSRKSQSETFEKILKVDVDFPIYLSPMVVDFINKILHRQPQKRLSLQQLQKHQWMRQYQNQPGRMISKQIWQDWSFLTKK